MDKIHHIAIQVDDVKQAVNWYEDKFDIKVNYQDDTWAMLEFDNISLALVVPGQHPPHFAIQDQEAEKFGELSLHRDRTESVYLSDPFDNSIEIIKLPK